MDIKGSKNRDYRKLHSEDEEEIDNLKGENLTKNIKQKKKMKMSKGKKVIVSIVMILLCIFLAGGTFFYWYVGKFSKGQGKGVVKDQDSINVLLLGLDIGVVEQQEKNELKRTDTIMLAHLNTKEKTMNVVSIPRDTMFKYSGKPQKINAAYAIGGDKLLKRTVEDMLNTKVDYIIKVDYSGFREVIDAIGGVDMSIERDMIYDDDAQDLHIRFYKGEKVHLDGKKAEEFFRWRKNNDGTGFANGDLDRIENQHKLLAKIMDKVESPTFITKVCSVLMVLPTYVDTDMKADAILQYGKSIMGVKKDKFCMETVNVTPQYINKISYVVYDKNKNNKIIAALNDSISTIANISKDNINIKILNCTKIKGLAGEVQKELESKGYSKISIGNGKIEYSNSEIKIKEEKYKSFISNDIKIKKYTDFSDEKEECDVIIMLGKDYKKFGKE